MPLFLTEEEFSRCSHDPLLVASKADEFIISLRRQLETVKAEADASSVTAEQTYNVLEQRYAALSAEIGRIQTENEELSASVEKRAKELAEVQNAKHEMELVLVGKDGEIERLKVEVSELHKSKRQLLELIDQKDEEIMEKNATIQSYLDKIVKLTEDATKKEGSLHHNQAELARCQATCSRFSQEKELIEKHNKWLNDELNDKVNILSELRKTHINLEEDMTTKLSDLERKFNESSRSLMQKEERAREYLAKITLLEEELVTCKSSAVTSEEHYMSELSTVKKLVELYKESSEEWSKKAGELEGVIKALETHLNHVEKDFKDKLEKEVYDRKELEKDANDVKEKLQKCECELEKFKTLGEPELLRISNFHGDMSVDELLPDDTESHLRNANMSLVVSKSSTCISGTALATSLLRDGWTLTKMYEKYHETADALRHERWGRKHAEAILERILREIEKKAETVLEERAEHEKLVDAYTLLNQKLQQALLESDTYETAIRGLKAELKKRDRDFIISQKEISDLQKQVTILLKECRDAQIRCGVNSQEIVSETLVTRPNMPDDGCNIVELTFKDIYGLVEQNCQIRNLVHNLSSNEQTRDNELKETFKMELQMITDEAAGKVEAVLKRCEEQACMIESLHGSVAMYKRLYEELSKIQASGSTSMGTIPVSAVEGKRDILLLYEGSQESARKAQEQIAQRTKCLEDDLSKIRGDLLELRIERDKAVMEATFAREKLDSFIKDLEYQREEANGVRARNVELSQLLIDYQRRSRESADLLHASEDLSRKLTVEVSVLKNEKEILINAEKRASEEVNSLTERVQRLQSSLDTIHSVEEVREESKLMERRNLEEHIKRIEREWANVKKELQEERDNVRSLKNEKERAIQDSKQQMEQIRKELSDSLHAVSSAETRAAVSEARLFDLEKLVKSNKEVINKDNLDDDSTFICNKDNGELWKMKEELEKLKEEASANKDYMIQYKEIAHTNEIALKSIEATHYEFKAEAEKLKATLEAEILSLKQTISDLEHQCALKSTEVVSAITAKEDAVSSAACEFACLKEACFLKKAKIAELETQISSLKESLDAEHERWRSAQNNYERQVILQSETIQELIKTSLAQGSLQDELKELREYADNLKAENNILKESWQSEKSSLLESKEKIEQKYKDIDEQNRILHNHLETLHIKLGDKDFSSTGEKTAASDSPNDNKLQSVINYLRHAREIADTEVSLLSQEKLRLQSQLESALRASERSQAMLQAEREKTKFTSFTDEDFKSLQLQVREINLLRESNAQLREENKHNFEQYQKFHEMAQKAKLDAAQLAIEKDGVLEGYTKEIETLKDEKGQLEIKVAELLQKMQDIDVVEYERLKDDAKQKEVKLKEKETEFEMTKKLLHEKNEALSILEQEHQKYRKELDEQQKKISDSLQTEMTLKSESEKHRKMAAHFKKKLDNLAKEKEGLNNENRALLKQIEDSKSVRKMDNQTTREDAIKEKEKDSRIQMLEKTLERRREDLRREREENKREKSRRVKTENIVIEHVQKIWQEKRKLAEEIRIYKKAICNVLEGVGIAPNQLPPETGFDEQTVAYFFSVGNFEDAVNNVLGDGLDAHLPVPDTSIAEVPMEVAGQQISRTPVGDASDHGKYNDPEVKDVTKLGSRRTGRKIVRPRLEQAGEPPLDSETMDVDSSIGMEGKVNESLEEPHVDVHPSSVSFRKRLASSSVGELKEDVGSQHEHESEELPLKKSKVSESLQEGTEEEGNQLSESCIVLPPADDIQDTSAAQLDEPPEEGLDDIGKDEKHGDSTMELQEHGSDHMDELNEGDEARNDFEPILELDKPSETLETDETLISDEGQDLHEPVKLAEDDREEGELEAADLELQLEEGELGQEESVSGDGGTGAAEAEEGLEDTSIEDLSEEKSDKAAVTDEPADPSGKISINNDQTTGEQESSSTVLQSTDIPLDGGAEQLPTGTPGDADESRPAGSSSRKIVLADRAKQNSLLRQAAIARGRGRISGGSRGENERGRRGRGGRGHVPKDGEQG